MGGVVKGFQIDHDPTGPLGDLTGKGDQSSGKVVHKDRNGPLGDLIGRGDQSSGKVVLLSSAEQRQPAQDHYCDLYCGTYNCFGFNIIQWDLFQTSHSLDHFKFCHALISRKMQNS